MKQQTKDKRLTFLRDLFGNGDQEKEVVDALAGVREVLDGKGVARKSYEPHLEHINKGMMEDLRDAFREAIGTITDDVEDAKLNEIVNQMVAQTIGMLTQVETDVPEEMDDELDIDVETMMGDEDEMDEETMMRDDYKSLASAVKEQTETIKALLDEKGMDYDDTFEILKEVGTAVKGTKDRVSDFEKRLERIEKAFNSRSRRASSAPETRVSNGDAEPIKTEMEKGLQDTDPFWN